MPHTGSSFTSPRAPSPHCSLEHKMERLAGGGGNHHNQPPPPPKSEHRHMLVLQKHSIQPCIGCDILGRKEVKMRRAIPEAARLSRKLWAKWRLGTPGVSMKWAIMLLRWGMPEKIHAHLLSRKLAFSFKTRKRTTVCLWWRKLRKPCPPHRLALLHLMQKQRNDFSWQAADLDYTLGVKISEHTSKMYRQLF